MNTVLAKRVLAGDHTVALVRGDLTAEITDAIVNAANAHLIHGGGVAGALAAKGGPAIQRGSDAWVREHGPVSHDRPAWTSGGLLGAKYVIHAVGPEWGEGDEEAKLRAAVRGVLRVADDLHLTSLAMPAISTGIFGFPRERAAEIILSVIEDYFSESASGLGLVRLVLYEQPSVEAFQSAWDRWA